MLLILNHELCKDTPEIQPEFPSEPSWSAVAFNEIIIIQIFSLGRF